MPYNDLDILEKKVINKLHNLDQPADTERKKSTSPSVGLLTPGHCLKALTDVNISNSGLMKIDDSSRFVAVILAELWKS